jgi:excinuclease ABC subunit C
MIDKRSMPPFLQNIPETCGVYLMKNSEGRVLYIGKAKNLKIRTRQYYQKSADDRKMIDTLIKQVSDIDCVTTKSEKEALLLERNFIQKHKPKYNSILKDDRACLSILVDKGKSWPRLELVRFKMLKKKQGLYFGPYTEGKRAKDIVNLVQQVFPLRRCSDHQLKARSRPCILYDMKRCLAPCVNKCSSKEYQETLDQALSFLRGKRGQLLKELKQKRDEASEKEEFERAQSLHKSIEEIEKLNKDEKGIVQRRSEDSDIFGLHIKKNLFVITKMIFRNNIVESFFEYRFHYVGQTDQEIITSFLLEHYKEDEAPKTIIIPCQHQSSLLTELIPSLTKAIHPKTGHKKELLDMANNNARISLTRQIKSFDDTQKTLLNLQKKLNLTQYPTNIECIDVSHFAGSNVVAACLSFIDGQRSSSLDRIFKIKWAKKSDDYGASREVLMRRLTNRALKNLPNLIIIDGARGHLNMAQSVLDELNMTGIELISISKQESKHNKSLVEEKIHTTYSTKPLVLEPTSKELHLLQRIRDATHTKAINFQKGQRKF